MLMIFFKKEGLKKKTKKIKDIERNKSGRKNFMTRSEILTIVIYYHHSKFRTFKDYYEKCIRVYNRRAFNKLVSYNRFIEIMKKHTIDLYLFLKEGMGSCTGISFIDSFPYNVCKIKRASSHKTFKGYAKKGKTSVGWFFGFKIHVTINHLGEIIDFSLTSGNTFDSNIKVVDLITKKLYGKLFDDRGYISSTLFKKLYSRGITLITKLIKNMKNKFINLDDKILLRKRGVIESVFNKLKTFLNIEHSRHRSIGNFIVNLISGFIAYNLDKNKPSIFCNSIPKLKAY